MYIMDLAHAHSHTLLPLPLSFLWYFHPSPRINVFSNFPIVC